MTERRYQYRMLAIAVVFFIGFIALGFRIVSLHAGTYGDRMSSVIRNRRFQRSLDVERGRIFDRAGNLLALDVMQQTVWADPSLVMRNQSVKAAASFLSYNMDVDHDTLSASLSNPARSFLYVGVYGTTVDAEQATTIQNAKLPGVFLKNVYVRSYPNGSSISHVLGYVNLERQGSAGVEQMLEARLRGIRGLVVGELDGRRRELYERRSVAIAPRRGADVILTIDKSVQHIVNRALTVAMREHDAESAWAIVQRVRTGEILAMASIPSYDPNKFRVAHPEQMRNRCISKIYEPGSTFKIAVVASALDAGVVTPTDEFDCENGLWMYAGRPLRDYRPHGELSVAEIIKKSSNIGTAKIALLLDNKTIYDYLTDFGIGQATGIGLPGEEIGLLAPVNRWSRLSPTRIAIGHEVAVTALQMINVISAIANDGILMKPHIVKQIIGSNGTVLFDMQPIVLGQPVSAETAALMKDMLVSVTEEDGTGRRARVAGYTVAGKTGTSQKAVAGGYSDKLNIASFAGFVPAEDPEFAIIVVVDTPRKSVRTGGAVAAPVFGEIAEQTLRYFSIPPSLLPIQEQGSPHSFAALSLDQRRTGIGDLP